MAEKNISIRVRESCNGRWFYISLFDGNTRLMTNVSGKQTCWWRKDAAIRNAKKLAKRIGIPYSDKIYKQHGC